MSKKQIINERVEKNLRVLKLLSNNDPSINKEQKRVILNEYSGWGGLREAIFTPSIYLRTTQKFKIAYNHRCSPIKYKEINANII